MCVRAFFLVPQLRLPLTARHWPLPLLCPHAVRLGKRGRRRRAHGGTSALTHHRPLDAPPPRLTAIPRQVSFIITSSAECELDLDSQRKVRSRAACSQRPAGCLPRVPRSGSSPGLIPVPPAPCPGLGDLGHVHRHDHWRLAVGLHGRPLRPQVPPHDCPRHERRLWRNVRPQRELPHVPRLSRPQRHWVRGWWRWP